MRLDETFYSNIIEKIKVYKIKKMNDDIVEKHRS